MVFFLNYRGKLQLSHGIHGTNGISKYRWLMSMVNVGATGWLTTDNDWVGELIPEKKTVGTTRAAFFSVACFSHICGPVHLGGFILWAPSFVFLKIKPPWCDAPHKPAITSRSFGLNIHPEKFWRKKYPKRWVFEINITFQIMNHGSLEVSICSSFKVFFSNSHNHGSVENGPLSPRWSLFPWN